MESRYKARSAAAGNLDAKALRHHRRSILQKTAREETFDRRRNLQLSPLIDESAVARISQSKRGIAVKSQIIKPDATDTASKSKPQAAQAPTDNRREMLKKWKEEKELKKKLEREKNAKKKTFKVCHVQHKDVNLYGARRPVTKKTEPKTTAASRPVTRSSARLANKPTEAKKSTATKKTVPTANTKRNVVPETRPVRSSTRIAAKAPPTTAAASTSRKTANSKKQPTGTEKSTTRTRATASEGKNTVVKKAVETKPTPSNADFGCITTTRGDDTTMPSVEESFAPTGFKFSAPPNLSSFHFKPLSPASTSAFFGTETKRRISTPHKHSGNLTLFSPDVSVIKGNSDSQSDDGAPAPVATLFGSEQSEEVFVAKPKLRRSVRFSSSQSSGSTKGTSSSSSEDSDKDQEMQRQRRASRRSVSFAADPDEPAVKTPRNRKLSGRKSTPYIKSSEKRVRIMDDMEKQEDMEVDQCENITPVMTRTRKISERKATPAVTHHDFEMADEDDTPRLRRSRRQSGPNLTSDQMSQEQTELKDEEHKISITPPGRLCSESGKKQTPCLNDGNQQQNIITEKEETPKGRSRRPSGRRLTPAPKLANADVEIVVTPRRSRRISAKVDTPMIDQNIEDSTTQADNSKDQKDVAMETQNSSVEQHDVPYFRKLVQQESEALINLCNKWEDVKNSGGITDDVIGQIFAAIGKAQLLMKERFAQFTGLIDDSEFHRGEKEITCMDLQGFWDMVAIQVDNVRDMFSDLEKLKNNNWQKEVVKPTVQKKAVVKKTKPVVANSSKVNEARAAAKKRLAEAKALMKAKLTEKAAEKSRAEEVKTFDAGFFKVSSPVKTPSKHCEAGTPSKTLLNSSKVAVSSTGKVFSPALTRLQQSPLATKTATPQSHSKTRLRRSLCQKNTPRDDSIAKSDGDNTQGGFNFAKYLVPSSKPADSPEPLTVDSPANVSVVNLNSQAEEFMKTEPTQQLQDLKMRSPMKTRRAMRDCNSPVSANKSLSENFSKLTVKPNTPTQAKMDSENYLFTPFEKSTLSSSAFNESLNLISFDSPSGQANRSKENTSDSLTNGLFSPILSQEKRRSTRRSTANPNPNPGIFSPL